jgi:hypothetical protein
MILNAPSVEAPVFKENFGKAFQYNKENTEPQRPTAITKKIFMITNPGWKSLKGQENNNTLGIVA